MKEGSEASADTKGQGEVFVSPLGNPAPDPVSSTGQALKGNRCLPPVLAQTCDPDLRCIHGLDLLPDNLDLALAARYPFTDADRQLAEFYNLVGKAVKALVLSVKALVRQYRQIVGALVNVPFHGVESLVHWANNEQLQDGDERGDCSGNSGYGACFFFQPS